MLFEYDPRMFYHRDTRMDHRSYATVHNSHAKRPNGMRTFMFYPCSMVELRHACHSVATPIYMLVEVEFKHCSCACGCVSRFNIFSNTLACLTKHTHTHTHRTCVMNFVYVSSLYIIYGCNLWQRIDQKKGVSKPGIFARFMCRLDPVAHILCVGKRTHTHTRTLSSNMITFYYHVNTLGIIINQQFC